MLTASLIQGKKSSDPCVCLQIADAASAVFGGAAFDLLHLDARNVSTIMFGVAIFPSIVWTLYAWWQCRLMTQAQNSIQKQTDSVA